MSLEELVAVAGRLQRELTGLRQTMRRRTVWLIAAAGLALAAGVGGAWWSLTETSRLHRVVDGDCPFWQDVGGAPVPTSAGLGRRIVLDARAAYDRRCAARYGPLPPPVSATPNSTSGR